MISVNSVKHFFGYYNPSADFTALTTVAPTNPPKKLANKQISQPSYLKSAVSGDSVLPEADKQTAVTDLTSLRYGVSTKATIRAFGQVDPDMSAAVAASARMGITKSFSAIAYDVDGLINEEGTKIAQQLIRKFDFLSDYSVGFARFKDIRSIAESLAKELSFEGSCALELVLDKARYPAGFRAISSSQIDWKTSTDGTIYPVQVVSGDEINLDIPTFFYVALDQDLLEPYSQSPIEPALHSTIGLQEFQNDLRRVFRRSIHPRTVVKIIEDRWRNTVSPAVLNDPDKLQEFRSTTITGLQNTLNGLRPEEILVVSDALEISNLNSEYSSTSDEYKILSEILNQKSASGNKAMPAILGHSSSSNNIASTESMLYLKNVEGSVQEKLNTIFSRAFTLAVRLYGLDVVVQFKYKDIDLRPELETEAFKAMKQSRLMEQLSIGLITDIEASIELTGSLPPAGAEPLSGTFFKTGSSAGGDPDTNSGEGSALNQTLKPDTPTESKTG